MANKDKEALALHRQGLKARLWKERARSRLKLPACVYCDVAIWYPGAAVMHEWLVKRNSVPVKMQIRIMHKYNCVLAHFSCHEQYGQTREFKLRCARAQYRRYGRDTIVAWVESLGLKQHVEIPLESEIQNAY